MKRIKAGDVLSISAESRAELGNGNNCKIRPVKFRVLEVYEHHVLCQNIETGIKESFTWWELKQNLVISNV